MQTSLSEGVPKMWEASEMTFCNANWDIADEAGREWETTNVLKAVRAKSASSSMLIIVHCNKYQNGSMMYL